LYNKNILFLCITESIYISNDGVRKLFQRSFGRMMKIILRAFLYVEARKKIRVKGFHKTNEK